jgi:hypothetical protein
MTEEQFWKCTLRKLCTLIEKHFKFLSDWEQMKWGTSEESEVISDQSAMDLLRGLPDG